MYSEKYPEPEGWPPGPWRIEPDRVEFWHYDFPCLVIRNMSMGFFCGYVGVPPGHPLHGKGYSDTEENTPSHGGLTYAGEGNAFILFQGTLKPAPSTWWLGFDCGHYMDLSPFHIGMYMPGGLMHDKHPEIGMPSYYSEQVYRDVEYVTSVVKELAEYCFGMPGALSETHGPNLEEG